MIKISNDTEKAVEAIVEPIIADCGFEYVDTEIKGTTGSKELIIYINKPSGITLDDCEKISRLVEPAIDAKDPIKDGYYLCVSSPGLDRALKKPKDFKRSIGKSVDVKLYKARDGQKKFSGRLIGYDDKSFTISDDKNEISFYYSDTAIVRLHVDF